MQHVQAVKKQIIGAAVLLVAALGFGQTPTPTPSKFCAANDGSTCVPWYSGPCTDGHLVSVCPTPGAGTPVPTHTPTPVPTSSQQYCHNGTACAPLGALGCPGGTINNVPCSNATPTPTQTPSVTATPTATPFPQPILTDLPRLPVTWTYAQNFCPLQLPDGSVIEAGNAGHVAGDDPFVMPSYGTELPGVTQECIYAVNYASSPPQLAVLRCSGWTVDEWERGGFRITTTGTAGLEGVTIYTRRPASGDYYHAVHAAAIDRWRLDSWPGQHAELYRDFAADDNVVLLPLGIVELSGERYLYATRVGFDPVAGQWFNAPLVRFTWHQDYGLLYPSNFPATTVPYSLTEIVLDTDGSLLSWDTGTADLGGGSIARQVRSRNQGLTWALTGLTIAARPGQFIADCHTLHNPGGVVVTPLVVECVTGTDGDWSKAGNWTRTLATWSGAVIPANMMVAAVQIPSGVPPAWWSAPRPAAAAVVTPGPRRTPPPLLWPLPRPTQAPTP